MGSEKVSVQCAFCEYAASDEDALLKHALAEHAEKLWREQPQGEATYDRDKVRQLEHQLEQDAQQNNRFVGIPAQTEGGEKPLGRPNGASFPRGYEPDDCPCGGKVVKGTCDNSKCPEHSSPPATAGTASRYNEWLIDWLKQDPTRKDTLNSERAEAYADQRADDTIVSLNRRLAEVLEAKVALATEVAQLRQELDALKQRLADDYSAEAVRMEREARERAEKALREAVEICKRTSKEYKREGNTCVWEVGFTYGAGVCAEKIERALASLKSSEGAKDG